MFSFDQPPADNNDLNFSEVPCWFESRPDVQARCGRIQVWGMQQSYQLPIVVLASKQVGGFTGSSSFPLMYLGGGPGSGLGLDRINMDYWFNWYRRQNINAPLILMDYRSTGLATPTFSCGPFRRAYQQSIVGKRDQSPADLYRITQQCRDIWIQRGFRETDFSSYALAQDIVAVAETLGYDTVNLYGVSFGTRLAMMVASIRPDLINQMVLDSPVYIHREGVHFWPQTFSGAIDGYFMECKHEDNCVVTEGEFLDALTWLKTNAMDISIGRRDQPGRWELHVDDHLFVSSFFSGLYNPETIFRFAFAREMTTADQKEAMGLLMEWYINELLQPDFNYFVYYANRCQDANPFDQAIYDKGYAQSRWQNYLSYESQYDVCSLFDRQAIHHDLRLHNIDTPTWVLTGSLDPITPSENARLLSQSLGNAALVQFKQTGHGVLNTQACLVGSLPVLLSNDTDQRQLFKSCANIIEE